MDTLVIFETMEGQTEKIARFAVEQAEENGCSVKLVDASSAESISFQGVKFVILAAPVHQRRHPDAFEAMLNAYEKELEERRTLMLSVSLSAAFPEGLEDAKDYLVEMKMRTSFNPTAEALIAGAVKIDQYDYFALQVIRHVVLRGRIFNPDQADHEFTDWKGLSKIISDFIATV